MQIQSTLLTVGLFLGFMILWAIKRRQILRTEGIDVNVINSATRPVQKYFKSLEKIIRISLLLIIIIHAFFRDDFAATNYFGYLDNLLTKIIGFSIGIFGLMICRIAQVTLGKSWRVGIDENARPGLITNGIYKYMRNPTYTGIYLLCVGVWIINPTFLYLYWILAFIIMIEFQVRCEEEYLETKYGDEYLKYCKKTKRYIPMIY